jgi:hypothetical protein
MVADMTLRFGRLRVPTTVRWPRVPAASLAFVVSDELSPGDRWIEDHIVVALAGAHPEPIDLAALRWVAEHVGALGAPADRLLVAGGARAARLAVAAGDSGWPVLRSQLLVRLEFSATWPMPTHVVQAPPATVVRGGRRDDGPRYAERLRLAGVEVHEVRGDRRG